MPTSSIEPVRSGASSGSAIGADDVARGIERLFARNDIWCLREMPLRNNRRADLMGVDAKGKIVIVEIKVARADLLGDAKWPEYLDYCDRFFWGLSAELDPSVLDTAPYRPESCGLIIADGYDAEIIKPAPTRSLNPARRRKEIERLARTAMRRHAALVEPRFAGFDAEGHSP